MSVIRFSVVLAVVVVAVGLLVAGAIAGSLALVYVAIAIAGVALLMLIVGVVLWRDEIFERASADLAEAPARSGLPADSAAGLGLDEADGAPAVAAPAAAAAGAGSGGGSQPGGRVLAAAAAPLVDDLEPGTAPRVPDWPGLPGDRSREAPGEVGVDRKSTRLNSSHI